MIKKALKGYMMLHAANASGKLQLKEVKVITKKVGVLNFVFAYVVQLFQSSNSIESIIKQLGPQVFNSENCKQKAIEAIKEVYWADDELCTKEQRHFFTVLNFFGSGKNKVINI